MPVTYNDISLPDLDRTLTLATQAFVPYKNTSLRARRDFLHRVATGLEADRDALVRLAAGETHLGTDRLAGEVARTCWQLRSYADGALAGHALEARIDTALPDRKPAPRVDIRKMMVPLGPVAVFGSSNFPFAYSTAGGDTACALAAGCPVVVKAHPAHASTSERVAGIVLEAAEKSGMPAGVFAHVHGASFEIGKALVTHPFIKAVGFTGSTAGGKALFDWANLRPKPIPVFSEMGSINPVFLLPGKLEESAPTVAAQYTASITQGVGQFCTNPGLLIGIKSQGLDIFVEELSRAIAKVPSAPMLHPGIAKAYAEKRAAALKQAGVDTLATGIEGPEGLPTLASTTAARFLENPLLHQEVFGPYSLLVVCENPGEMLAVAQHIEGQLTSTLVATESEFHAHPGLVETIQQRCGRFIWNGVPTGVEVVPSMQHGGPYPATTDSRFTSVGEDGIKRFMRPLCFQQFPDHLLPEALQDANPLGIWRLVNGEWKR
ncbi:aldehyde dehydrogenase (NADP(+)) [Dinghuibacter silviterrae]|uniref:NADP-dependent aldehyde dehydrogenase n=1 Tax=Dinghuibacter silviterrae TaxID=1539049 RepID=A0A4R8DMD5_9BACT|nr:aldehyde dehydrogenase (NADP(+)) [Dinghuibacter silviterrae]TDW99141.1 NADP-dependent aldehyde dehydrogenase [Dinghuibacter silviterrae]